MDKEKQIQKTENSNINTNSRASSMFNNHFVYSLKS